MAHIYCCLPRDVGHNLDPLCPHCAVQVSHLHEPLTSPVQHLLSETARHSPSPTEEVQIREAISQAESRINGIDVTTAKIQLLLSNLAEQRAQVQAYRDKHKVLVAPVWHIPPEILSYIFVLCLSECPPNEIKRSSLRTSLLLARVNQFWRQVALSTPQLWSTIFLDSKSLGGGNEAPAGATASSSTLCMPKVCLERSGACPLSITIFSQEFNLDILDFIIPLSDRWRRMSLNTNITMLQSLFPIQGKLPCLEHLEIRNTQWTEGPPPALGVLPFFSDAPRLKHVMVSNTFQPTFGTLPLQQLTTWDSPIRVPDFPQIFQLAPNLEECFIQPLRWLSGSIISENESTFSHNLTSLHISTGTITNLTVQLHHLPRFPCLRQLFLYCDKRVLINSPETTLVPFFAKSGGQLEYLMFGISVALDMITQCLAHTPMLTSLHIHRVASDLVLNLLTLQDGYGEGSVGWLVPKLEILRLSGKLYFQARTVTKLIRSRWRSPQSSSSPSSSHPSGSTSTSYRSNTTIPVSDARPRTLRSVDILPPRQDKFAIDEKNELLALNRQGFEVNIRSLDRPGFLSHHSMLGSDGQPIWLEGHGRCSSVERSIIRAFIDE
jgi:F-box-like